MSRILFRVIGGFRGSKCRGVGWHAQVRPRRTLMTDPALLPDDASKRSRGMGVSVQDIRSLRARHAHPAPVSERVTSNATVNDRQPVPESDLGVPPLEQRKVRNAPRFQWCWMLALIWFFAGCGEPVYVPKLHGIHGETMGTAYNIVVSDLPDDRSVEDIQAGIDEVLLTVNRQMSNWIEDSEISRFNNSESSDWFEVSPATAHVIAESIRISEESGGAFDVTVAPLIDLWGFGPAGRNVEPPTDEQLDELAEVIGSGKLSSREEPPSIRKDVPGVSVNLSAIAKGYGVDAVAEYFEEHGIENYLVEIGGEVRVAGRKPDGSAWRIGIERPEAGQRSLQTKVQLTDRSMATSGDYRNFIEKDGRRYSHTIDPRTLKPVSHSLASVTVLAETCLEADALATSLMVMGPDEGYNWAEERGIPVLMLIHEKEEFSEHSTTAWHDEVGETP